MASKRPVRIRVKAKRKPKAAPVTAETLPSMDSLEEATSRLFPAGSEGWQRARDTLALHAAEENARRQLALAETATERAGIRERIRDFQAARRRLAP